ncbi:hypothetical protein ACSDQ9_10510 [Aestuariimicrobium soli]|uniref:hypothetical protein n=1 Tax=Aestuariimicrobium soli TaxID=2035834 RepID=UPI003EBB51BA
MTDRQETPMKTLTRRTALVASLVAVPAAVLIGVQAAQGEALPNEAPAPTTTAVPDSTAEPTTGPEATAVPSTEPAPTTMPEPTTRPKGLPHTGN